MKDTVRPLPQTGLLATTKPRTWIPALAFLVAALAIGTTGFLLFKQQALEMERTADDGLAAVADLKLGQIVRWLGDQRNDAEMIRGDNLLVDEVERWFQQGAPEGVMAQKILARLDSFKQINQYEGMVLLDGGARPRLRVAVRTFDSHDTNLALQAMRENVVTRSDVHWSDDQKPEMDMVAPLAVSGTPGRHVTGAVYFHIDPSVFFFPYIQSWPTKSPSGETLLARRDGNEVLFLNELRHRKGASLKLRLPIDQPDLPAAMALRGQIGEVEGVDYRGVPVIAATRKVPDTPWILVAKLDRAEVEAPLRGLAATAGGLAALFMVLAGAVAGLWWRKQYAKYLVALLDEKLHRKVLEQHFDLSTKFARDIVFLDDASLRVLECNDAALNAYGYSLEELRALKPGELRAPETRSAIENDFRGAGGVGGKLFETVHQRKDGSTFPVETSTRMIEIEGQRHYHSVVRDITERRRAQDVILQERNFIGAAIESLPGLFYLIDDQGRFLRWNRNFEMVSGYSSDEISRLAPTDFFTEPDKGIIADKIRQVFLTGEATAEADFVAKDQTRTPYFFTGRRVEIDRKSCLVGMGIDMTGRVQAERRLATQYAVARALAESSTLAEAGPAAIRAICAGADLEFGEMWSVLWSVEARANVLRCSGIWHAPSLSFPEFEAATLQIEFAPGVGLPGRVWASGEPAWIPDVTQDANFPRAAAAAKAGLGAGLAFPLKRGGQFFGVVGFFSREIRQPDDGLSRTLSGVADQISQFIERVQADATLRESNARYRIVAEAASDVIVVIDQDSRIEFINPASENVFGYTAGEMVDQSLTLLIAEDQRSAHVEGMKRYVDTGRRTLDWKSVELRGRHKSGKQLPVEISFGEFNQNGKRFFSGIIRDITARKQAEARIARLASLKDALSGVNQAIVHAESEQPLFDEICSIMVTRAGFDSAAIGIADPQTGDVEWAAYAGAVSKVIPKTHKSVRADRPEGRGPTGTAIREGRHVVCQDFANDPSTAPWHTIGIELGIGSVASFPIFRAGKAVGVINVDSRTPNAFDDEIVALLDEAAQDVSFALDNLDREAQRKQINEALQESETRYRSLFENMLNGFAYCKLQYDNHDRPVDFVYLSVNNAFECLTGLKNVAGKQATEAIPGIKEAHPELFEIYGRVASTGIPASFEIDFKPLRRWFSVSVYSQEKGYFVAIFDNITERKNSELAVHESEEKLRAIFEGALDGILVADMETRKFLTGNPTICRMLGYTLEEIVRIGVSDIHPEQELPRVIEQFERLLRGEIQMAADIPVMRKDSSVFYADIKAAPIRLGSKDGLLGIFRDNTERKRADDRIRRLNRIYAVLSGINSTIVRVSNREELFSEACRIAVEAGTFRAAWLGIVDRETNTVRPVAWHGLDSEYIRAMPVEQLAASDGVAPGNVGLAPLAIMERKPMIAADVTSDPRVLLRKEALERGFRSLAILPLLVEEEVVGVLALYAGEVGFFDEEEMKLLNELAGDISFALDHIAKANKLDYLVFYDQLTGLANRALFLERVNQSIHAAGRAGGEFALAILDIERLRTINESLGRQACDALIKLVAQRLRTAGGLAGVGRISADHFALVLDEVKGRSEVVRVVSDALRKCFGESFDVSGTELRLSAKAGVALYPGDGVDAETLLRNAEAALRKAKDLGERQVFYTAALTERAAGRLTLENQLRQALEKEQFVLHYQPKVDLESRAIVGVEALIRWQSPALGLVPPGKFIPLMEETGLILEVGTWALRQAALDHRKWLDLGLRAPRVAVNVSAIQLRQRDFVANVERAIMEGIAPTGIDLEITESLIMEDVQGSIEKLKAVRGLGVRIAIDDFGTGYSSLGYLAKLPVQTLKIDRSFIITMLVDPDIMTLVQTVISLAHSLQLTVVAEGVEEDEQAKMLRLLRCDQMQGYLFSKPIQFEAMTALLTQGLAQS